MKETGYIPVQQKNQYWNLFSIWRKFINATKKEYPLGLIGLFALRVQLCRTFKRRYSNFNVSLRVQESPGM